MQAGPTITKSKTKTPVAPKATPFDPKCTATTSLGWMASLRDLSREHGFEPLHQGTLPAELNGTLYRTGPSLFSSFGKPYGHLFDGDGAVTAVRFREWARPRGGKLVQTEGLVKERRAGRQLYGGYGTATPGMKRFWPPASRSRLKNPANTSILLWGERVFALYEGDLPTEIAPSDLATLGEQDLGIVMESFSAHPHAVPPRRAIYNFGLRYGRKTILDVYELDDSGGGRKLAEVPLAQTTLIQFVATEKRLVFFAPPVRFNPLRLLFGLDTLHGAMRWTPLLGTGVIVVPIDDPEHVTRFTMDPFFQWHFLNAYERGNEIVVDVVRFPNFESNNWFGELIEPHPMSPYVAGELWRVTLDPRARRATSEPRWAQPCEFPRVAPGVEVHAAHDRLAGRVRRVSREVCGSPTKRRCRSRGRDRAGQPLAEWRRGCLRADLRAEAGQRCRARRGRRLGARARVRSGLRRIQCHGARRARSLGRASCRARGSITTCRRRSTERLQPGKAWVCLLDCASLHRNDRSCAARRTRPAGLVGHRP